MKLTCPACSAQYTIATERLEGRRVKVRCKRCGDSFPVDASQQSGEVYARQSENRRGRGADLFAGAATAGAESTETASATPQATPLTGERNESSVLFSLASLSKQAPAPATPTVTESSALIDIRALVSAGAKAEASPARADDIMNLSGGGAFAPLFAPPVTFVPVDNEEAAGRRHGPIVIGAIAFAAIAMVSAATFAGVRSRSNAAPTRVSGSVGVASVASTSSVALAATASEAPPASSTPTAEVTPVGAGTTATVAPPARAAARANDSRTVAAQASTTSTTSTTSTAPKCCPGESEMACHMRVAAGATCSVEPTGPSDRTSAPPFDRAAAARALALNVASCKRGDASSGAGHVKVTFQPSGTASAVEVDAPYAGTATGSCVAQRYRSVSVPAFAGAPLSVGKSFVIE